MNKDTRASLGQLNCTVDELMTKFKNYKEQALKVQSELQFELSAKNERINTLIVQLESNETESELVEALSNAVKKIEELETENDEFKKILAYYERDQNVIKTINKANNKLTNDLSDLQIKASRDRKEITQLISELDVIFKEMEHA